MRLPEDHETRMLQPHYDDEGVYILIDGDRVHINPLLAVTIARAWFTAVAGKFVSLSR